MRAFLITLLAAGCFSPDIGEGALVCGDNNLCPEGFSCAGGHCYQNPPSIDAPVDAPVDAAPCAAGGFVNCSGHDLLVCAGGDIDAGVVHCDFGCNQAAGQCNLCDPGTTSCDSQGNQVVCDSMGLSQALVPCTSDNKDCTQDICVNGACAHPAVTDGIACSDAPSGASGACLNGNCVCGDDGQPCCSSTTCNGGLVCSLGHCGNCGSLGQVCCTNQTCGPGFVCANNCQPCGGNGDLCCANSTCDSGFTCMGSHCQPCGGLNQACCMSGMQCSGTLTCNGTSCFCTPSCAGRACGADDGCGNPCQTGSCSQSGTHCVSGECRCDGVSCSGGCCSNNMCLPGDQTMNCGNNGNQCQQCMGVALCVGQVCQL
jgi:hypothetical protein